MISKGVKSIFPIKNQEIWDRYKQHIQSFWTPEEVSLQDDLRDLETLTEFRDRLREETGFIIRTTDFKIQQSDTEDTHALRISTHLFHDEDDVNGLVEAMLHIYNQMA